MNNDELPSIQTVAVLVDLARKIHSSKREEIGSYHVDGVDGVGEGSSLKVGVDGGNSEIAQAVHGSKNREISISFLEDDPERSSAWFRRRRGWEFF